VREATKIAAQEAKLAELEAEAAEEARVAEEAAEAEL
jgi:hypothetical protein